MTAAVWRDRPAAVGVKSDVAAATILTLVLAFAAGNRWFGFGRDYLFYVEFYDRLGLATKITEERFEPGFTAGAWLFKYVLGLPYAAYATVLVGGTLAAKFALFFRTCRYPLVACLVYVAAFYPLHEYTQIRIAVALAFGLWGAVIAVRGRPLVGGLLIVAGAAFQSSEIVVGLGVAIALLLRLRLPVAILLCVVLAVVVPLLIPADPIAFLAQFNPLAQDYVNQLDVDPANFLSMANIETMLVIACMAPFAVSGRERLACLGLIMCLMSVLSYALLKDIPAFAHRFREMFALFVIPLVFCGRPTVMRQALAIVVVVASVWQLRQFIADGVLG